MNPSVSSARAGVVPGCDALPLLTGPLGGLLLTGSPDTAAPRLAREHGLVLA